MQIWVEIAPQHAHTVMMRLKQSFICTWNVKSQGNSGLQPENGILGKLGFLLLLSYQVLSCLDLRRSNLKTYLTFFYRSVRYCIFKNRKKTFTPSLKYFITLVKDEMRFKYNKNKILKINQNGVGINERASISSGGSHPPKNKIEPIAHINKIFAYSPSQNIAYIMPEYSV